MQSTRNFDFGTIGQYSAKFRPSNMSFGQPSIRFMVRDYTDKDGYAQIAVRIYYAKKDVKKAIGLKIKPKDWDADREKAIGKSQEVKDVNLMLEHFKSRANTIFIQYRVQNKELTIEKFLEHLFNSSHNMSFLDYMERKIEEKKKSAMDGLKIVESTSLHHASILRKVKSFRNEILFGEMDEAFFSGLITHFTAEGNKPSTINNMLKRMKTYLLMAQKENINVLWIPKLQVEKKPKIEYLNETEIHALHNYFQSDYCNPTHKEILRLFLFSCETGARFGDVIRFTRKNILGDHLIYTPEKTEKFTSPISILLTQKALSLIENLEGRLFNCSVSNAVVNRYLKHIADLLKVKKLHFHMSRHTFACSFLQAGGSLEVLMELMGHSNIRTTMKYVHVSNQRKDEQMRLMDKYL